MWVSYGTDRVPGSGTMMFASAASLRPAPAHKESKIAGRARAAQALTMLHNRTDTDGVNQANAILDELCLDRKGGRTADKEPHAAATEPDPMVVPQAIRPPSEG
jgi:hypothetical protein